MKKSMDRIDTLFEDQNLIVINKPAGIPVHGGPNVKGETLVDFLLSKFPEVKNVGDDPIRPGIVHRLDKDTSGVLVVARNQDTFEKLKLLFKLRKIEKVYLAIVCGRVKTREGSITLPIGRAVKNPTRRGVDHPKSRIRGAREAHTDYRVLKKNSDFSLLEVRPKTGRTHQIRVHLKSIGHPVACDSVYGGKKVSCPSGASRQLLHAKSLAFSFPEGRKLQFEADPPDDFSKALEIIDNSSNFS